LHSYRFPEVRHPTQAFLGEFAWAAAISTQTGTYYRRPGWTTGDVRFPLPHPVLPTNDTYFWESGYDCSIDDTFSIEQPCKELIDGIRLAWRGNEGQFYDAGGTLIASDPSVKDAGPSALVVGRAPLLAFLEQQNLAILWIVFGERQVIAPRRGGKNYSELSGVYILREGVIEGDLQAYSPPDPAANEPGDRER
jgi:hypothetical protein